MKKRITVISIIIAAIAVIASILVTLIASFYVLYYEISETGMSDIITSAAIAENDTHVIIDNTLINKSDGTAYYLKYNKLEKSSYGDGNFHYEYKNVYKYEFCEDSIKEYVFISDDAWNYNCVISYGYDGIEISRSYLENNDGNIEWTDNERKGALRVYGKSSSSLKETHSFNITYDSYSSEYDNDFNGAGISKDIQELVKLATQRYISKRYLNQNYVTLLTQKSGEEIIFSAVASDEFSFPHLEPTINAIHTSELASYNTKTKEIKTIYKCKKKHQIIDFDENGIYTIDSKLRLCYVDIKTEKSILIYDFSEGVGGFIITDKYIYTTPLNDCFLYEKGGSVITSCEPANR